MTVEQLKARRATRVQMLQQAEQQLMVAQINVQRVQGALAEIDTQIAELEKENGNGKESEHTDHNDSERGDDQRGD